MKRNLSLQKNLLAADRKLQGSTKAAMRWALVQIWYLRALSFGWLFLGLVAWSVIVGADPLAVRAFEDRAPTFQAVTIYFAVVDVLAAVGLWLLTPWGSVVWLIAIVSRITVGFVFPASYPLALPTVALMVALIASFMWLSWMVGRRPKA